MPATVPIYLTATWGGFLIMGVELLSGKILSPYFGSSIYVWGAVITIFMLSLSIGYFAGGRLSLYRPSPAKLGVILLAGSLLCIPTILFAEAMMEWLFMRIEDPRYGSLAASAVLFFVPIAVLGMISPYSVRLLTHRHEVSGRNAGTLYFASTLGSAVGTIATSFYLVLWFEINHVLWTFLGISCIIALPMIINKGEQREVD